MAGDQRDLTGGSDSGADPGNLPDATEAEIADLVAEAWAEKGYETARKEHGSHVFVFAKRQGPDGVEGEIIWVAAQRTVDGDQLEQLRSLAGNVGASGATCLTVGPGGLAAPGVADDLGIEHVDGDDLRADLGYDGGGETDGEPDQSSDDFPAPPEGGGGDAGDDPLGETGGSGLDPPPSDGESETLDPPESRSEPGAPEPVGSEPDSADRTGADPGPLGQGEVGPGGAGRDDAGTGSADAAAPRSGPSDGADPPASRGGRTAGQDTGDGTRLGVWGGQTTSAAAGVDFTEVWSAVTDGGAVTRFADLDVWNDTTRLDVWNDTTG